MDTIITQTGGTWTTIEDGFFSLTWAFDPENGGDYIAYVEETPEGKFMVSLAHNGVVRSSVERFDTAQEAADAADEFIFDHQTVDMQPSLFDEDAPFSLANTSVEV